MIVQEAPRTAGYGAELAAILAEKAMLDLRAPVIRVTGYDVPYPYWQIEDAYMPVRRAGRGCAVTRRRARVLSVPERLRLWLERGGAGYYLRDAATGEPVRWEDPRLRVVPVAGVTFRPGNVDDASFDPGRRLALVREPGERARSERGRDLERGADAAGRLRAARRPRPSWPATNRPSRSGASRGGLRVLIVPPDAWVGTPR